MVRSLLPLAVLALLGCAPIAGEETRASGASDVGGALFVAGKFGNTLARIDLASGEETARVASCVNPHELATSPDERYVALACYGGRTVDIFRTSDLGKVKSIELGEGARPHGIVWHANGDLYATAEGRQSIYWIKDPLGAAETFEYASGQRGTLGIVRFNRQRFGRKGTGLYRTREFGRAHAAIFPARSWPTSVRASRACSAAMRWTSASASSGCAMVTLRRTASTSTLGSLRRPSR